MNFRRVFGLTLLLACGADATPVRHGPGSPPTRRTESAPPTTPGADAQNPLSGHALLGAGVRLHTAPEMSSPAFELEVDERGALFSVVREREGWVELHSWRPKAIAGIAPMPPACVPLARGLEVVDVSFFVRREQLDPATVSEVDPLGRFACTPEGAEHADPKTRATAEVESPPPPLQSGRARIRLPRGRGTVSTEWELSAGTRLAWPDGSPAGRVLMTHRYAEAPTSRNGQHCVSAFAGIAQRPQLAWCAKQGEFVVTSFEQKPMRRRTTPASDRARTLGILSEMGLDFDRAQANQVYDALAADPEMLEELFRAQEKGQLGNLLPEPPPSRTASGIQRK